MGGRLGVAAVSAVYGMTVAAAAVADAVASSSTRALLAAVIEAIPALVLAAAVSWAAAAGSRRRGAIPFTVAMVLLACGLLATSGAQPDAAVLTVGTLFVASGTLTLAYLRTMSPRRRQTALAVLMLPGLLVVIAASIGLSALTAMSRTRCGVDSCAFTGLGIAFTLGLACEGTFLMALVMALAADLRSGAGVLLFAVGANLLLVVAPQWSRGQGIAGTLLGYAGLALAALPWLAPREDPARTAESLVAGGIS